MCCDFFEKNKIVNLYSNKALGYGSGWYDDKYYRCHRVQKWNLTQSPADQFWFSWNIIALIVSLNTLLLFYTLELLWRASFLFVVRKPSSVRILFVIFSFILCIRMSMLVGLSIKRLCNALMHFRTLFACIPAFSLGENLCEDRFCNRRLTVTWLRIVLRRRAKKWTLRAYWYRVLLHDHWESRRSVGVFLPQNL